MDKLVAEGATLTPGLLLRDEAEYDKVASSVASRLQAVPSTHLASNDALNVCRLRPVLLTRD
jgi:hypothetical protein